MKDRFQMGRSQVGWMLFLGIVVAAGLALFVSLSRSGPGKVVAAGEAAIDMYSQCSNDQGTGYTTGDTGCRWINGNLQHNNSLYREGEATVQRLAIDGLISGTHTVTIQYGTTKGGKHAYDFLTDPLFSENWITRADFCDPPITNLDLASCSTLPLDQSPAIPPDSNAGGFDIAAGPQHFYIVNGDITAVGVPTLASGSYAGDSETTVQLTFTVDTATCANPVTKQGVTTCEVLITWGAHVASQADWGIGKGAAEISGSPYHVATVELDGTSIGQRDNQMQANTIVQPTPTPTPTITNTPTPTNTFTPTPTNTFTPTPTNTFTPTPTNTFTPTPTNTFTPTPTNTNTPTPTSTNTPVPPSPTPTSTNTPVPPSPTPTSTNTPVPPSPTPTSTNTPVPPSPTPTNTNTPVPPSPTPTSTNTPVPPSPTPTSTNTPVPPTGTPVPPTVTPTHTLTPRPTHTRTPRHNETNTPAPTGTTAPTIAQPTPRVSEVIPAAKIPVLPSTGSGGGGGPSSGPAILGVLSSMAGIILLLNGLRLARRRAE